VFDHVAPFHEPAVGWSVLSVVTVPPTAIQNCVEVHDTDEATPPRLVAPAMFDQQGPKRQVDVVAALST
jgi:hypothetical protein